MTRSITLIVILAAFFCAWLPSARAQTPNCTETLRGDEAERIGCVNRILERRWLFFDRTVEASRAAEIRRASEAGELRSIRPVRTEDPLANRDLVRLGNTVDLELFVSAENTLSRVVLERGGVWEIQRDTLPRLVITHGQMVVDQLQGRLEAYLQNVLNVIHATTVYYDVDSTSGESFVFLREGRVSFPEYDIDAQGENMLWVLRGGAAPELLESTADRVRRWRAREDHANQEMWEHASVPILRRSKFWLLAGGVVLGAVLLDCSVTNVICYSGGYSAP